MFREAGLVQVPVGVRCDNDNAGRSVNEILVDYEVWLAAYQVLGEGANTPGLTPFAV